jgi:hypothetical protein
MTRFIVFIFCLLALVYQEVAALEKKNGSLIVEQIRHSLDKKSEAILENILKDMVSEGSFCYCNFYFQESYRVLDKVVTLFNNLTNNDVEFTGRRDGDKLKLCIKPKGQEPEPEPEPRLVTGRVKEGYYTIPV